MNKFGSETIHPDEAPERGEGHSSGVFKRARVYDPSRPEEARQLLDEGPTDGAVGLLENFWLECTRGKWNIHCTSDLDGALIVRCSRSETLPKWNERELDLLPSLLKGEGNAQMARALSLSEATICRRVNLLVDRVGISLATVVICMRVFSKLPPPTHQRFQCKVEAKGPGSWTASERAVARLALVGLSVHEMTVLRRRSAITIRKQLRGAALKANCVDKLELAARLPLIFQQEADPAQRTFLLDPPQPAL